MFEGSSLYSSIPDSKLSGPILEQMLAIDTLYFKESTRSNFTKCWNWWRANNSIYTLIRGHKDNQVAGYINAMPLVREKFEELKLGRTLDITIKPSEIVNPTEPGRYKLYVVSIAVRPHLKTGLALKCLSETFIEKMIDLAKKGIFFDEVLMDAFTPEGVKLSKYFGGIKLRDTSHDSQIYKVKITDSGFPSRHAIFKELQDLYLNAGL